MPLPAAGSVSGSQPVIVSSGSETSSTTSSASSFSAVPSPRLWRRVCSATSAWASAASAWARFWSAVPTWAGILARLGQAFQDPLAGQLSGAHPLSLGPGLQALDIGGIEEGG